MKASKVVFLVLLIILSLCIVTVQPVKSQFLGSVFIQADGSIVGTDRIQRNGNLYTLTGNISGGIQVQKSGIIIDGAGYTIKGNGEGRGIDLSNGSGEDPSRTPSSNVTVKNLRIVNFGHGVDNDNANNSTFYGNYITDCDQTGIWIIGSSGNTIMYNTIKDNLNGISICYSGGNNVITKNNMINNRVKSNNVVIVWLSPQPTVDRNYWSDYNGTDNDGDGIGDTPYLFINTDYARYRDYHPLVKPVNISVENSWVSKTPMHEARGGLGVAVANGRIYAIGGWNENGLVGTNEAYDPATESWSTKASIPTPRASFAISVYQSKIYCIGGTTENSDYSNVNEVYYPETDTWETKTPMPTARLGLQANVVNGKIYLIGGLPENLNEVYDPASDTWATETPLPTPTGFVSAVVDNKIYSIGTYYNGSLISVTQIYNPDTDVWITGAPPPSSINGGGYATAAATTGENAPKRIYVFGITASASEPNYFVRIYNPENDSWTFGADPITIRNRIAIGVVNDMLYMIGGSSISIYGYETFYATNEQYTPFGYGTVPPKVALVSPESKTYNVSSVSLMFGVNKPASWMAYSLDGHANETITGNTTLTGLSNGLHNLTVYAKDAFENVGSSETVYFTIAKQHEPFPTTLIVAAIAIIVVVIATATIYLTHKRKE